MDCFSPADINEIPGLSHKGGRDMTRTTRTIRTTLGIAALLLALPGYSIGPHSSATASPRSVDAVIRNVNASHCEAFVERGALVFGNGQRMTIRFYIKLHPERLDGDVIYVGFHGFKQDIDGICNGPSTLSNPACQNVGMWTDYKSKPFVHESNDYHDIRLDVSDIDGDIFTYEGVFFVQTDVGTRYWIHANPDNGNFRFSESFLDSMVEQKCAFEINEFDLALVPVANDVDLGLNPDQCQ